MKTSIINGSEVSRLPVAIHNLNFNAWLQAKSGRDVTSGDFTASLTATFEYI
ncbi:hypothetical protein VEE46_13470 [Escherichia coli]|nr:hypothetical protein VEE46_13470 [Escherichia coli]